jgi:NodT family efflux transporter outer membrane factor (OMF) lipoprotein
MSIALTGVRPKQFAWLLGASIALSGCATTPQQETPQADLPVAEQWAAASTPAGDVEPGWLARFSDAGLEALVKEALVHNYDLQIAAAQLDAASAAARKAASAYTPSVDLAASAGRSGNTDSGASAQSTLGVSLDVAWEVDVWGRVRAGASAAESQSRAAALDLQSARHSLAAQVAKAWLAAIEANLQRTLAADSVDDLAETLRIVEVRFREGQVSLQDVHLARTDLALAEEQHEAASNAAREAARAIELLLGRYPRAELAVRGGLPALTSLPAAGLPAQLLERRPDLRAAEARIAAAFSLSEQARAARLPRINLTSSLGTTSDALRNLADPVNTFWQLGINLLQPLIDGGRLRADVDIADARQREAVAAYAKRAQGAFAEVERTLTAAGSLQRRVEHLRAAEQAASEAHRLMALRYQAGESDLLNVLEAHRRWLDARKGVLRVALQQHLERVNLALALGGEY